MSDFNSRTNWVSSQIDFVVCLAPNYGRNWGWFRRSFGTRQWQKLRTVSSLIWHQTLRPKLTLKLSSFSRHKFTKPDKIAYSFEPICPEMKIGPLFYKFWILTMQSSTHHFVTEIRLQSTINTNTIAGLLCQEWNTTLFLRWRWNLGKIPKKNIWQSHVVEMFHGFFIYFCQKSRK